MAFQLGPHTVAEWERLLAPLGQPFPMLPITDQVQAFRGIPMTPQKRLRQRAVAIARDSGAHICPRATGDRTQPCEQCDQYAAAHRFLRGR